jgi:hypothetical protein
VWVCESERESVCVCEEAEAEAEEEGEREEEGEDNNRLIELLSVEVKPCHQTPPSLT